MAVKFLVRRSEDRGRTSLDWLDSFQTFSLYDAGDFPRWGILRHLNEDRIKAGRGFGEHPHRELEIFSYVVSGQISHEDSMGNRGLLRRGDIQMNSTGTGIRHSELACGVENVHMLQIWVFPWSRGLRPTYYTRHFSDADKKDKWARVVAPLNSEGVTEDRDATGPPAPVHAELTMYASLISTSTTLTHMLPPSTDGGRRAYIHMLQVSGLDFEKGQGAAVRLIGPTGNHIDLREGDGAFIQGAGKQAFRVENIGDREAEVVLLDMDH